MNENEILSCGKENVPKEWKIRAKLKKIIGAKSMINNVFNNLDKNVAMTTSDISIEKTLYSKFKNMFTRSKDRFKT